MDTSVVEIAVQTMIICAKLCAPILVISLAIGLLVSLFQSVTQIQEITLTFVPKLIGVGLVLMLSGHWMLGELIGFTNHLFDMVPRLLQTAWELAQGEERPGRLTSGALQLGLNVLRSPDDAAVRLMGLPALSTLV